MMFKHWASYAYLLLEITCLFELGGCIIVDEILNLLIRVAV